MPEVVVKKGWQRVTFGDVVQLSGERSASPEDDGFERYVGLDHIDAGDLKIRRWGNVAEGTTFTNVFRPGQVLFGKRRAYQRKIAVADFSGVCSGDIYVLQPKDTRLLVDLLPYICQTDSFFEYAVGTSAGSLSPRTNWYSLASYEFLLPPPEEQSRISALLIASERSTESIASLLAATENMRASLITNRILGTRAATITAELTKERLSPGWRLVSAGELSVDLVTKGATPSAELTNRDTGIPFLKVYNLTFNGRLDFSIDPTYITSRGHSELQRSKVRAGDVLMNIVGPPLGKVARVPDGFPECNINQAIVRFRLAQKDIGDWLTAYLLSSVAQNWLLARSKKTSGQRNLTLETCRDLPVPVPPEPTMREIVGQLSLLESTARSMRGRLNQAVTLGRTLLAATLEVGDV